MAREIKFRAWHEGLFRMCDPEYIDCEGVCFDGAFRSYEYFLESDKYYVLMQYTGLKDKNGREIYEGDIVEFKGIRAKIIYGFCGFEFEWIDGRTDKIRNRKTEDMFKNTSIIFEVIGNIYENKELC